MTSGARDWLGLSVVYDGERYWLEWSKTGH